MTREKLVSMDKVLEVFDEMLRYADGPKEKAFVTNIRETVASIEAERVGEVVLGVGEFSVCLMSAKSFTGYRKYGGMNGTLIFRPEVER